MENTIFLGPPGGITTSRLVQAIGTALHHPLTIDRGYRHIRTSWGYRHIQACTSSSPGAIGTSRLVQAIGTAPHHPLTIDRGYQHIRSPTIAVTWDHFIQEHASSEIARLKALLDQRTIPSFFRLCPPLTTQQRSRQAVLHAVLLQAISRARFHCFLGSTAH